MESELRRLNSFQNWPHEEYPFAKPSVLAKTGFFLSPTPSCLDRTVCFCCHVSLYHWEREDEPLKEHMKFAPNCPFVTNKETNNVPIRGKKEVEPDMSEELTIEEKEKGQFIVELLRSLIFDGDVL